jgi:hypothetical protein
LRPVAGAWSMPIHPIQPGLVNAYAADHQIPHRAIFVKSVKILSRRQG